MKKESALRNANFKKDIIITKNGYSNYSVVAMDKIVHLIERDIDVNNYYELYCNNNYFNTLFLDIDGETEISREDINKCSNLLKENLKGYTPFWICLTAHGKVMKNRIQINKKSYHIIFRFIDPKNKLELNLQDIMLIKELAQKLKDNIFENIDMSIYNKGRLFRCIFANKPNECRPFIFDKTLSQIPENFQNRIVEISLGTLPLSDYSQINSIKPDSSIQNINIKNPSILEKPICRIFKETAVINLLQKKFNEKVFSKYKVQESKDKPSLYSTKAIVLLGKRHIYHIDSGFVFLKDVQNLDTMMIFA